MNQWLLWLALCTGALACTVEPIADSSEDEGGDDESDDGSDDDDDHMAHVDAGSKMDAGKKDAGANKDAGKKDAGKKDGAISVPCGDDAGTERRVRRAAPARTEDMPSVSQAWPSRIVS